MKNFENDTMTVINCLSIMLDVEDPFIQEYDGSKPLNTNEFKDDWFENEFAFEKFAVELSFAQLLG